MPMKSYMKRIAVFLLMIVFAASSFFAAPARAFAGPIIATILEVIIPPLIIVDALSCSLNAFWGCGGGGGGGGGGSGTVAATPCTTSANICGMTNTGNKLEDGSCDAAPPADNQCPACTSAANACGMVNSGYIVNGSCNVSTAPNTQCPAPVLTPTDNGGNGGTGTSVTTGGDPFYAKPSLIAQGASTTVYWNVQNATDCDISGNGLDSGSVSPSGQMNSGIINATTVFSITCENGSASSVGGAGPKASTTLKITIFPKFQEF